MEDIIGRGHERTPFRDDEVQVNIGAAQIAPKRGAKEWVSILNMEADPVDLQGWTLTDRKGKQANLSGIVGPGESRTFVAGAGLDPVKLPNNGGLLILKNPAGEQVDRIDYTEKDLKRWTAEFGAGKPVFVPVYRNGA